MLPTKKVIARHQDNDVFAMGIKMKRHVSCIVDDKKKKLYTNRILNLKLKKVNRKIFSKKIFERKTKNIFQIEDDYLIA